MTFLLVKIRGDEGKDRNYDRNYESVKCGWSFFSLPLIYLGTIWGSMWADSHG